MGGVFFFFFLFLTSFSFSLFYIYSSLGSGRWDYLVHYFYGYKRKGKPPPAFCSHTMYKKKKLHTEDCLDQLFSESSHFIAFSLIQVSASTSSCQDGDFHFPSSHIYRQLINPIHHLHNLKIPLRGLGVDNVDKGRLQRGTANKESINVLLLGQLVAVLLADTATVDDACRLGSLLADLLGQPLADSSVNLLCLLRRGHLARTNGPDGLVRNHNLAPVLDLLGHGTELVRDDLDRLAGLTLLERLAAAQNHAEATIECGLGLARHESVGFLQNHTTLAVAEQSPRDVAVLELSHRDFTSKGTVGAVKDVLRRNLDAWAEVLPGEKEVEEWWGNDDLCCCYNCQLSCQDEQGEWKGGVVN